MGEIDIVKFEKIYSGMTLKVKQQHEIEYKIALIKILVQQFNLGIKSISIGKATRKGTILKFASIKTKEEAKQYRERLAKMINDSAEETGISTK